MDFISVPVTNAFTSATSLIIIGAQLKNLLGISYSSKGFADSLYNLVINIGDCKLWDGVLGLVCCVFLLLLRVVTIKLLTSICINILPFPAIKGRKAQVRNDICKNFQQIFMVFESSEKCFDCYNHIMCSIPMGCRNSTV